MLDDCGAELSDRNSCKLIIEQWTGALLEPHIPTRIRVDIDQRMARLFAAESRSWTIAFGSAFLFGLVTSLPADDPWRGLRFRIPGGPEREPVAPVESAWRKDGRVFGHALDVTDLVIPSHDDHPETDYVAAGSLLTVPGWFSSSSGALVAACAVDLRVAFQALAAQAMLRPPPELVTGITEAAAAVLFRRRAYLLGWDDSLPLHVFASIAFADEVAPRLPRTAMSGAEALALAADLPAFDEFRFEADDLSSNRTYRETAIRRA